jgi:hypothetical protein
MIEDIKRMDQNGAERLAPPMRTTSSAGAGKKSGKARKSRRK